MYNFETFEQRRARTPARRWERGEQRQLLGRDGRGDAVRSVVIGAMNPHRSSLGSKRPREEFASVDHEERTAAGYPPSVVGGDALPHHAEHAHDSPQRHTPGVTPGVCEPSTPDERYSSPRRPESGVLRVAPALRLGEQRPSQQLRRRSFVRTLGSETNPPLTAIPARRLSHSAQAIVRQPQHGFRRAGQVRDGRLSSPSASAFPPDIAMLKNSLAF